MRHEDLVVVVGDCHVGRRTKTYDVQAFRDSVAMLKKNVAEVKAIQNRGIVFDRMHIFMVGDIVDGEEVYRGQAYEQDAITIDEMIDVALDEFVGFVDYFADNRRFGTGNITIWCVHGNHGRANRRGSEMANWDRMFYKLLRQSVGDVAEVHIADDWYLIAQVRGWQYMLLHGDCIRMYQAIPVYGIQRNVARWLTGAITERFDVVVMGHFHTVIDCWVNDIRVLVNGTMLPDDRYTQKMALKPITKYWVFGVSNDSAVTWQWLVDVR